MKETGILFTPENHHLILSGQKFQTRRVITPQPEWDAEVKHTNITGPFAWPIGGLGQQCGHPIFIDGRKDGFAGIRNPYGGVGDKLYIKEGVIVYSGTLVGYYMDGVRAIQYGQSRLTAMFMAKRYARTWLEITEVRVQRVQDISEEDAKAEGVKAGFLTDLYYQGGKSLIDERNPMFDKSCAVNGARGAYAALWDSINGKPRYVKGAGFGGETLRVESTVKWSDNPWTWALTFKLVTL